MYYKDNKDFFEYPVYINRKSLISMETPYYVTAQIHGDNLQLDFTYAQTSLRTECIQIKNWIFYIGEITGRIFRAILKDCRKIDQNSYFIDNKYYLLKKRKQYLKIQNFKTGILISQAIAQSLLKINCSTDHVSPIKVNEKGI